MRINNNLMAMNTHRQLGINSANGAKSIEKLSSGNRINRAGDDAAGLAISEKMRSQVRGLNQASRNGQDGISLIQTAEGALNESQAILQRMRELAVQSANDTNVDTDRTAIQNEIDQLGEEINRIATTTEFNTQSLLKGDGGVNISKTQVAGVDGKLGVAATGTAGVDSVITQATNTSTIAGDTSAIVNGNNLSVTLNGISLTATFTTFDATKGAVGEAYDVTVSSATAMTAKINTIGATAGSGYANTVPGQTAAADDASAAFQAMIDGNEFLAGKFTVDNTAAGIVISAVAGEGADGPSGTISTVTGTLTTATFGAGTASTGTYTAPVAATKDISLAAVTTTALAKDLVGTGMTINDVAVEFYDATEGVYEGNAKGIDISAATQSTGTVADDLAATLALQFSEIDGVDATASTSTLTIAAETAGVVGNSITVTDGSVAGKEFNATFQIGSNESQTMNIEISDMRAEALGIEGVNISTSTDAQAAITTIDKALGSVSNERAKLGAFQNRLEHTIKNLDTSSENLQASESRIRDVDMAKEMMEFTKNNILQQAAQAMLAQANQAPQGVLQLLR